MSTFLITLGSIVAALWIANFIGIKLRDGKTWMIPKGHHYAKFSWFPIVIKKRKAGTVIQTTFNVNQTMLHDLPGDEDDWDYNKITGEGYLSKRSLSHLLKTKDAPHHFTSWRIGWNYLPKEKKVQLAIYYYLDGKRYAKPIHSFLWYGLNNTAPEFKLQVSYEKSYIQFILTKPRSLESIGSFKLDSTQHTGWTYRLRPYFGGNNPAPADVYL
jgi:hypothetical protein